MALNFELGGREGAAEAVLLSSGLGGTAGFWQLQLAALGEHFRVITYDQRGTGRNPDTLPAGYAIADMAADVIGILDAAQIERCHFVGHALGGLVGLQLALDHPQRLQSLAVVNGWSRPNPHTARCFAARRNALKGGGVRAYVEAQPIFLYPPAWCVANDARVQAEVEHGVAHFQGEANLLSRIGALLRFDIESRLGEINTSTWVAASRDDVLVPWTCSRDLAAGLENATLSCVPEGGHGFTVTQAEAFNRQLLDFLTLPCPAPKEVST